ncbi:MAG TPA: response regulator transcription factor [Candidatus Acidoferrales bacterium]|nr:response regulator transcription factor [Candidatus Acidoferrales bacterium]
MRILVAVQDSSLGTYLNKELAAEKIVADLAHDSEQMKSLVAGRSHDAAILDIDLSSEGGYSLLRDLRAMPEQLPVLVLATGARPGQQAQALDLGADDFLSKPFELSELLARLRALVRGRDRRSETVLRIDNLELRRDAHVVTRAGQRIRLTPKEFALLECLLANAGECVTRSEIVRHVWHHANDPLTNIVDVYVNYLRKKVDVPFEPKLIHTVRGVGYQLKARNASDGKVA